MNPIKKVIQYGDHQLTLETGEIARQASGSVMVSIGDTVLLVTAVGEKSTGVSRDFFPMTVDYQEKVYAAGRIPGGFFRREGRASESETLTSRLIDRPLRPLFPKGFTNEVQVIATVMSLDPEIDTEVPAMIGASAALSLSGLPFNGPIGCARVGFADGQYLLNPSRTQREDAQLDLMVAGTDSAVLMVESEARELSEEEMLGAVLFGHEQMQVVIKAIEELVAEVGVTPMEWQAPVPDEALHQAVAEAAEADIADAYLVVDKLERLDRLRVLREGLFERFSGGSDPQWSQPEVYGAVEKLEKKVVRGRILAGEPRIDGRDGSTVRDITIRTGVLPRTHGSALFTRGETQALVVATLGTQRDAQIIDALDGERRDPFMLHYNFPPYSVGETGRMGGTKRREVGHGRLAKRGVLGVMPEMENFPYTIRVVSEITESNGSSSMASVCGSSLAMMDAGVPLSSPVAGIAMGLVKDGERFAVLSDILGDEDHLGDMDFKVAGTEHGITALQMDIKIEGITREIMETALTQARQGRLHILNEMNAVLASPREEMSDFAPRIMTFKVHPDKIRDVIGKGGATIRSISEQTGAKIDVKDDGTVKIASVNSEAGKEARRIIEQITTDVEVGRVYDGKVAKLMDFGAFVTILPGKDGLVHISQISNERVEKVSDKLTEGDTIKVKVLEVDRQGRIRLSMKAVEESETH